MIYTGYFSKIKEYKSSGYTVVSISRTEPFPIENKLTFLAPDEDILWRYKNGEIDEMEYTSLYLDQLDRIGIRNVLLGIHSFGDDVVIVLGIT